MLILSTGFPLMIIVFDLEDLEKHAGSKLKLLFASVYLLVVLGIAGHYSLLRLETFKMSKAYSTELVKRRKLFKEVESDTRHIQMLKKDPGKRRSTHMMVRPVTSFKKTRSALKLRVMIKMITNLLNKDTWRNNKEEEAEKPAQKPETKIGAEKLENKEEGEVEEALDYCAGCWLRKRDSIILGCQHAVFCQFCARDLMNMKGKCPICDTKIEKVVVITKDSGQKAQKKVKKIGSPLFVLGEFKAED